MSIPPRSSPVSTPSVISSAQSVSYSRPATIDLSRQLGADVFETLEVEDRVDVGVVLERSQVGGDGGANLGGDGLGTGSHLSQGDDGSANPALDDGGEKLFLRSEVVVERARLHIELSRDVGHAGCVEPALGEEPRRSGMDLLDLTSALC